MDDLNGFFFIHSEVYPLNKVKEAVTAPQVCDTASPYYRLILWLSANGPAPVVREVFQVLWLPANGPAPVVREVFRILYRCQPTLDTTLLYATSNECQLVIYFQDSRSGGLRPPLPLEEQDVKVSLHPARSRRTYSWLVMPVVPVVPIQPQRVYSTSPVRAAFAEKFKAVLVRQNFAAQLTPDAVTFTISYW
jgi:hypothetical protein